MESTRQNTLRIVIISVALALWGLSFWGISIFLESYYSSRGQANLPVGEISINQVIYAISTICALGISLALFCGRPGQRCIKIYKCIFWSAIIILSILLIARAKQTTNFSTKDVYWPNLLYLCIPFMAYLSIKYKQITFTTKCVLIAFFFAIPYFLIINSCGVILSIISAITFLFLLLPLALEKRIRLGFLLSVYFSILISCLFYVYFINDFRIFFDSEWRDILYGYLENTPLVGVTTFEVPYALDVQYYYSWYGLGFIPIAFLLRHGWLLFLLVLLGEILLVCGLFLTSKTAQSLLGKYSCIFLASSFSARLVIGLIAWFYKPISHISVPFIGESLSASIDVFLFVSTLCVSNVRFSPEPELVDLNPSTQITIGFILSEGIRMVKNGSNYVFKLLFKLFIHPDKFLTEDIAYDEFQINHETDNEMEEIGIKDNHYSSEKRKTQNHILPSFKIGVTFCGEYREKYVQPFCEALLKYDDFSKKSIFYDGWHEHLINGPEGDKILRKIYYQKCKLVVVLLSPNYSEKKWTNYIEWPAIRELINSGKANKICLLRVDKAELNKIDGLWATQAIVKDIDDLTPDEVATFIYNKWKLVRSK